MSDVGTDLLRDAGMNRAKRREWIGAFLASPRLRVSHPISERTRSRRERRARRAAAKGDFQWA